ncbi:MAG: protein kinase domain-containing protein [Ilumatobacteraceae bacterium]
MTVAPRIDGYTDLVPIGTGGIGDVYRAVRSATDETVAIKVLRDVTDQSVAWHRTRRELHALRALDGHPNVIQVVDVLHGLPGFVMDHAPGGSVAALLDRCGPTLAVPTIVMIASDTASALRAAHEQGIIHRDVKPQNLLIDAIGRVRLCDFGIASLTRSDEFRTATSARSMRYASPEDLEEDVQVGPATDVYSLGATLVHLLRGSPPTLKERLAPWEPEATDDPERSALAELIADCLHPDPARRPSPVEVLDRIGQIERRLPEPCTALPVIGPVPLDLDRVPEAAIDETVGRGRRRAPTVVRPEPPTTEGSSRRVKVRRPAAILAVALFLGVTGSVLAAVLRSDDDVGPIGIPRPAGLVPLDDPSVVWPTGAVGDCLLQIEGSTSLRVVDCDRPHDLERFHLSAIDDADVVAVNDEVLDDLVEATCLSAAPPTAPDSPFRIATSGPTSESWASGERTIQCFLGVPGRRTSGIFTG